MKILIVIDYQNDFVTGSLGFESAPSIDSKIADTIMKYSAQGAKIIATRDTHEENYLESQEGKYLPIVHCVKNTKGWEIFGKTKSALEKCSALYIDKPSFGSAELMDLLRGLKDIEEINICGVVTNICVISNAVIAKAACPEARINVIENLCLSNDAKLHEKAVDVMESMQIRRIKI